MSKAVESKLKIRRQDIKSKKMKIFFPKVSMAIMLFIFIFYGCDIDDKNEDINSNPEKIAVNIIGKWQMSGTTQYGIEFTNYGIAIWKHTPYMNSNLNYSITGTTLIVSNISGTVDFSNEGNTLKISGFSDPSSFGTEGSKGPFINGTYIRQN